jgi:hypothetical protein
MPKSPPSRVLGPLQAGSSPTPHHQRLDMLFTPSTAGCACSGYAGLDFHCTRPTCPQIKHRTMTAPDPALLRTSERRAQNCLMRCESPCCLRERYVRASNDCKNACKNTCRNARKNAAVRSFQAPASSSRSRSWEAGNKAERDRQKRSSTFADHALDAVDVSLSAATDSCLAAVGRTNAGPAVAHLHVMHARIVCRGRQLQHDRR